VSFSPVATTTTATAIATTPIVILNSYLLVEAGAVSPQFVLVAAVLLVHSKIFVVDVVIVIIAHALGRNCASHTRHYAVSHTLRTPPIHATTAAPTPAVVVVIVIVVALTAAPATVPPALVLLIVTIVVVVIGIVVIVVVAMVVGPAAAAMSIVPPLLAFLHSKRITHRGGAHIVAALLPPSILLVVSLRVAPSCSIVVRRGTRGAFGLATGIGLKLVNQALQIRLGLPICDIGTTIGTCGVSSLLAAEQAHYLRCRGRIGPHILAKFFGVVFRTQ
jgi:hypothetical protein